MDTIYSVLEEHRRLYFQALKEDSQKAEDIKQKVDQLEQEIEDKFVRSSSTDTDDIIRQLQKNIRYARAQLEKTNNTTNKLLVISQCLDSSLSVIRSIM